MLEVSVLIPLELNLWDNIEMSVIKSYVVKMKAKGRILLDCMLR